LDCWQPWRVLTKNRIISGLATVYVEVVRGIPLLVQLLFWYFAFPTVIKGLGELLNIEFLKNYLAKPVAWLFWA
jgi:polar amino acid transport system permease protein